MCNTRFADTLNTTYVILILPLCNWFMDSQFVSQLHIINGIWIVDP